MPPKGQESESSRSRGQDPLIGYGKLSLSIDPEEARIEAHREEGSGAKARGDAPAGPALDRSDPEGAPASTRAAGAEPEARAAGPARKHRGSARPAGGSWGRTKPAASRHRADPVDAPPPRAPPFVFERKSFACSAGSLRAGSLQGSSDVVDREWDFGATADPSPAPTAPPRVCHSIPPPREQPRRGSPQAAELTQSTKGASTATSEADSAEPKPRTVILRRCSRGSLISNLSPLHEASDESDGTSPQTTRYDLSSKENSSGDGSEPQSGDHSYPTVHRSRVKDSIQDASFERNKTFLALFDTSGSVASSTHGIPLKQGSRTRKTPSPANAGTPPAKPETNNATSKDNFVSDKSLSKPPAMPAPQLSAKATSFDDFMASTKNIGAVSLPKSQGSNSANTSSSDFDVLLADNQTVVTELTDDNTYGTLGRLDRLVEDAIAAADAVKRRKAVSEKATTYNPTRSRREMRRPSPASPSSFHRHPSLKAPQNLYNVVNAFENTKSPSSRNSLRDPQPKAKKRELSSSTSDESRKSAQSQRQRSGSHISRAVSSLSESAITGASTASRAQRVGHISRALSSKSESGITFGS